MRRAFLGAVLLLAACTPGVWQKRQGVDGGGARGRLYLPHLYAPLLPGSIYPDKRKPLPVEGRPGALVVLPPGARRDLAVEALGERGFVALVLKAGPSVDVDRAVTWLRARPECAGAKVVAIVPAGTALGREAAAVALMGTAAAPLASPAPVALFGLTSGAPPSTVGPWALEKWYRPDARGRFPAEAWRDAAEWLALVLAR